MSFLDDLKTTLADLFKQPGAVGGGGQGVTLGAQKPGSDPQKLAQAAGPILEPVGKAGAWYQEKLVDPWEQWGIGLALWANPDTYKEGRAENPVEGWQWAKSQRNEIASGEALADLEAQYWGPIRNFFSPGTNAATGRAENIDIYDLEQVDETYRQGSVNPLSSNYNPNKAASLAYSSFYAFSLFGDPLIGVGKLAKVGRLKFLEQKIEPLLEGDELRRYNAIKDKQGRAETVLTQRIGRLEELQTKLNDLDGRVAAFNNAARSDIGPAPTFDDAYIRAQEVLSEGRDIPLDPDSVQSLANDIFARQTEEYSRASQYLEPEYTLKTQQFELERTNLLANQEKAIKDIARLEDIIAKSREAAMPRYAANLGHFVNQIIKYDMRAPQIARHRFLARFSSDPYRAASVLEYAAKSKNPDDLVDAFMVMGWGDQAAIDRLISRRASIGWVLERARGKGTMFDDALEAEKRGMSVIDYRQSPEYQDQFNKRMAALLAEDDFLRNLVGDLQYTASGEPIYRTAGYALTDQTGTVRGLADARIGQVLEPIRARRAVRKGDYDFLPSAGKGEGRFMDGWNQISYNANPMLPTIHVMEFVGAKLGREAPSGWLPVRGIDDGEGAQEMISWLQQIPAWNNKKSIDLKKSLFEDFINAPAGAARRQVAEEIETQAIRATARANGIDATTPLRQAEKLTADAAKLDESYKEAINKVDDLRQSLKDASGNISKADEKILRSETKKARALRSKAALMRIEAKALEDQAKKVDAVIDEIISQYRQARQKAIDDARKTAFAKTDDDNLIYAPLLVSQLASTHFLPDMRELTSFFERNKGIIESAAVELTRAPKEKAIRGVQRIYSEFDSIWRPAVLLRLGYMQRNVMISGLQAANALEGGALALWGEKGGQAFDNWVTNRWNRVVTVREQAIQAQRMLSDEGINVSLPKAYILKHRNGEYGEYLADRLELARADLDEALASKGLPGSRAAIKAAEKAVREAEAELTAFGKASQRIGSYTNRARIGQQNIVVDDMIAEGSYGSLQGREFMDAVSSNPRLSYDLAPAQVRGVYDARGTEAAKNYGTLNVGDYGYWEELTKVINKQLKNSEIVQMIWRGSTEPEMLAYLRSAKGQTEMRNINWDGLAYYLGVDATPENYLTRIVGSYERYLPTQRAKDLVLKAVKDQRDITIEELRVAIRNSEAPADVVGVKVPRPTKKTTGERVSDFMSEGFTKENIGKIGFAGAAGLAAAGPAGAVAGALIGSKWTQLTQKAFKYLSTIPEDRLIRHPFADAIYTAQVNSRLNAAKELGETLSGTQIASLQENARKFALRETRTFLYTVIRRNGIASTTTGLAMSPFFQAQLHTIKAWSRIGWEQPARLGYTLTSYARLNNSQVVHEDPETGQRYLLVHIPEAISNRLPKGFRDALIPNDQWRIYTTGFNLIAPGWRGTDAATGIIQSIGIGPVAAMSLQRIAKEMPDMDQRLSDQFGINVPLKKYLNKFVPDEAISDTALSTQLLPPILRRIQSLYYGSKASKDGTFTTEYDGPADFAYYWKYYYDYRYARFKLGLDDQSQTQEDLWNQAREDTQYFFAMRFLANLTLPFIPQYTGALTPLYGEYRRLQAEDPMQAFDRFMEQYGEEYIHMTSSLTNNWSGANANEDAVFMAEKNRDLIADLIRQGVDPEFVQMVTNRAFTDVEYDPASRVWQIENDLRGRVSPIEAARLTEIRVGWYYYRKMQEKVDAQLAARGLTSIAQKDAADLRSYKKQYVDWMAKKYPSWYNEGYTSFSSSKWETSVRVLETLLSDDNFMKYQGPDSWFYSAAAWLDVRNRAAEVIAQRGSGDIDSDKNVDVRVWVDWHVNQLKRQDPNFARMYDRFYERDPYKVPVMKGFER